MRTAVYRAGAGGFSGGRLAPAGAEVRVIVGVPAKVRWHRDPAPARTSRATPRAGGDDHGLRPSGVPRTLAARLAQAAPGSKVRVEGWVHRRRVLATVTFLIVRDRSGLAQVVVRDMRAVEAVRGCGEETVVAVIGVVTRNPAAPGGVEVTEPQITLLGEPAQVPPVDVWRPSLGAGLTTVLDHAAVTWRHPARRADHSVPAG